MTQAQLASVCQRTSSWLLEFRACAGDGNDLIEDLTPLIPCTKLTALDLSYHRKVRDFTPLSALTSLRELRLRGSCHIFCLDPFVRGLSQLSYLDVGWTRTTSLEPLALLTQLKELDLQCCNVLTDLQHLDSLVQLKKLNLYGLRYSSLEIGSLVELEELNLGHMMYLASLEVGSRSLRKLGLDGCSLPSLDALGSLSNLLDLDLTRCHLPPSALAPLSRCTALKVLSIRNSYSTFDLAPLASCRDLRQLYTSSLQHENLMPLQGLLPRLEVKLRDRREDLDARDL